MGVAVRKENPYYWPRKNQTYTHSFANLTGGLNLRDAEINLKDNETPDMLNLWIEDGVLQCRPGQAYVSYAPGGAGYAVFAETFWGYSILHIGDTLCYADFRDLTGGAARLRGLTQGVPENRGTFARFGDYLFYKNRGGFYKIVYDNGTLSAVSMTGAGAFVPTILINADPDTGGGDAYQPENRLSVSKRVTYNASYEQRTVYKTGDGVQRAFNLTSLLGTGAARMRGVADVYINDEYKESALYTVDTASRVVIFNAAPPADSTITFTVNLGTLDYHLPVTGVNAVTVKIDGITMTEGTDYTADLASGVVHFLTAPPVTDPPTDNTVEITYAKANDEAFSAVMNCPYLTAYGAGTQLCLVAGGCPAQPNAVFWTGSTQTGLDPSYWPVSHYNFVGDSVDSVMGFGKQYDELLVFKGRSIGKLNMTTAEIDGRETLSLTYETVNPRIGCDLPNSIQTIENNLVFATTGGGAEAGIYLIQSASAAYENNVVKLSRKVDGSNERPGLLYDLRVAGRGPVFSYDDGKRYWLSVNGRVWLWDYSISGADDPSWFRFSGFQSAIWFQANGTTYHLDSAGRVTQLGRIFDDYGEAIRKVYRFPARNFGNYDRLKDVREAIFTTRKDTPSNTSVTYHTDYEARKDLTNLQTEGYDRLTGRNLEVRDLSVPLAFASFRRKPMCRHVRHFAVTLENNEAGKDLTIYGAEIQYRFAGRDK